MGSEIEYQGLMALAWDPLRGDTSGWEDRSFYLAHIRAMGGPILDVGCGTGRLLLDFLSLDLDVDGVEISPDMVAILEEKAHRDGIDIGGRVHVQAMESMVLPRRYQVIIVPSSSFQLVIDARAASAAMGRFFRHLVPDGILIMPWIDIAVDYGSQTEEHVERVATLADGSVLRRRFRGRFDAAAGVEHTVDDYELVRDGIVVDRQTIRRSPATRHYQRSEIARLHAAAGFADLRWFGGFTTAAPALTDRVVTTLARRPERRTPLTAQGAAGDR